MSNKLKIGNEEFELASYSGGGDEMPTWYFNLKAKYDEVLPLINENQTYIVISSAGDVESELDLSDECNVFVSLKNIGNESCELVLSGFTSIDLLNQMAQALGMTGLKKAYKLGKIVNASLKRLVKLKIITEEQYEEIVGGAE